MRRGQLHETLRTAFPCLQTDNVTAFIDLLTVGQTCDYIVKTTRKKVIVPKQTSVQIDCKVQTQPLKKDSTLLFESDTNPQWAEGLQFSETLLKLRHGVSPNIVVEVQNPTDHDIELSGRTSVGTVQQVQAVYPATVFERPSHPPPVLSQVNAEREQSTDIPWNRPINLTHLSEPERVIAQNML